MIRLNKIKNAAEYIVFEETNVRIAVRKLYLLLRSLPERGGHRAELLVSFYRLQGLMKESNYALGTPVNWRARVLW